MRDLGGLYERAHRRAWRVPFAPIAAGVLASVVALAVVGCGSSSDTADKSATQAYLQATHGDESAGRPPAGSVVVDRGITAAGETFVARLEPRQPRSSSNGSGCLLPLSINTSGNGMSTCMYRSPSPSPSHSSGPASSDFFDPSVDCASARLTVTINTLPAARSVRLSLSNGGQITSRVLFVPAARGGPAGYYYQVVRGPSPIPVSLTELDARDRTLRTVTLPHIVECTQNPIKYLPGGVRTLVHDRVPNGPGFSITGERYRFLGRVYFELKVHVEQIGESGSDSAHSFGILGRRPSVLDWQIETGCHPHPYVILYSLLKAPGGTVSVRTSGKLTAMRRVTIPAIFRAGGALVYSTSIAPSSELVIRTPNGTTAAKASGTTAAKASGTTTAKARTTAKASGTTTARASGTTVHTEKLGSLASAAAQTCRGESEGR